MLQQGWQGPAVSAAQVSSLPGAAMVPQQAIQMAGSVSSQLPGQQGSGIVAAYNQMTSQYVVPISAPRNLPGQSIPIAGPNIPVSGQNMSTAGRNVSMGGEMIPIIGQNVSVAAQKMPLAGNQAQPIPGSQNTGVPGQYIQPIPYNTQMPGPYISQIPSTGTMPGPYNRPPAMPHNPVVAGRGANIQVPIM